jgi:hypothetical protein
MAWNDDEWPRDALPKGTDLLGYRIEAGLGRGGFGITYQAIDGIDQPFAIKEYFPRQFAVRSGTQVLPSEKDTIEPFNDCLGRFNQEARSLRQLAKLGAAGDGVVKVVTFFQANGTAYTVMEMLEGDTLEDAIRAAGKKGLSRAQLDRIVPPLLHAIGCVHHAGLLHRDIKPANIILRPDFRPVLIDFGAARTSGHGRTTTYTRMFSAGFGPYEQFDGSKQGPFSDIYALGATLYSAIGGTIVDAVQRRAAWQNGTPDPQLPAARIGAGRYNPSLLAAIDAAMAVEPERRPQSIAELQAVLDSDKEATRVFAGAGKPAEGWASAPTMIDPKIRPPPPPRGAGVAAPRHLGRKLAIGLCLCLVAIGGVAAFIAQLGPKPHDEASLLPPPVEAPVAVQPPAAATQTPVPSAAPEQPPAEATSPAPAPPAPAVPAPALPAPAPGPTETAPAEASPAPAPAFPVAPKQMVVSVCDKTISYTASSTSASFGMAGVWSGNWKPRLCGALIVEGTRPDGRADIIYSYKAAGATDRFDLVADIDGNTLQFDDPQGGHYQFMLDGDVLHGRFTGQHGYELTSMFQRQ